MYNFIILFIISGIAFIYFNLYLIIFYFSFKDICF